MVQGLLFELSTGYALFEVIQTEAIGKKLKEVQEASQDLSKFGKFVKLKSFLPYRNAEHALKNVKDISEGLMNDDLKAFLEMNLSNFGKKGSILLGVSDKNLAANIRSELKGVECDTSEVTQDLLRGVRFHIGKLLKQLQPGDLEKAQLGLGHSYSRAKVKFNVNKVDNHIINAIALLDQLNKDINTFSMRVREWYGWHMPELIKFVSDNYQYAKIVTFIGNKTSLSQNSLEDLAAIINNDVVTAQNIINAARTSMGQDISALDMKNILIFAQKVVDLSDYKKKLYEYLVNKMNIVAPNLTKLIGEVIGARLISHAGSLTNLSKYPASTIQILGAEKALFRALKTKGNTPKYGLIYHSSFIGRAGQRNKGRISRFLANKCSIASRIDNFTDMPTTRFGEILKEQVEERLAFYETGSTVTKNSTAMKRAMDLVLSENTEKLNTNDTNKNITEESQNDKESDKEKKKEKKKDKEKKKEKKKDKEEKKKKKKDKEKKREKEKKKEKKRQRNDEDDSKSSKKIKKSK
ncbi:hypothetical protein PORY_002256 [Pneumocystis oryctolagi]|uniref:Uncharacterized protein n=1 Tax=Pneumocystis oryctolagi TaxID=42067 RepID=A0ACB7C9N5_9ASCO|nr:hypothetical protein PORY_002256 [Pneumocystis oryctolagi]